MFRQCTSEKESSNIKLPTRLNLLNLPIKTDLKINPGYAEGLSIV